MKEYLQKIFNWMLWGFGAFIVFYIWNLLINADWSGTKSTTDATPAWSLYSTEWTVLTAQKWNEAMSKVNKDYPQESLAAW